MNRKLYLVPVAALALLLFAAFMPASSADVDPLEIGATAPLTDVPMVSTDGDTLTLAEAAAENGLLVMFTCNTCPWVAAWEDRFNTIAEQAEEHGIGFVALNPNAQLRDGDESLAAMAERAAAQGYAFPYLVDENNQLADAFGATRTPEMFLFDSDMTLVYHGAIDDNAKDASAVDNPYVLNAMSALVSGEEVAEPTTRSVGCTIKRAS